MTGLNCRWPCEADGASQASICRGLMICFSMESFYFLGCGLNKRLFILYLKAIKAVICRIWPEFFLNELTLSIELEEQQCWSHVKGISVLCFRDIYWRYHATLASPIPSCLINPLCIAKRRQSNSWENKMKKWTPEMSRNEILLLLFSFMNRQNTKYTIWIQVSLFHLTKMSLITLFTN